AHLHHQTGCAAAVGHGAALPAGHSNLNRIVAGLEIALQAVCLANLERGGSEKVEEGKLVEWLRRRHPVARDPLFPITGRVGDDDIPVLVDFAGLDHATVKAERLESLGGDMGGEIVAHSPAWRPTLSVHGELKRLVAPLLHH